MGSPAFRLVMRGELASLSSDLYPPPPDEEEDGP
jgi:hypothetical protein